MNQVKLYINSYCNKNEFFSRSRGNRRLTNFGGIKCQKSVKILRFSSPECNHNTVLKIFSVTMLLYIKIHNKLLLSYQ